MEMWVERKRSFGGKKKKVKKEREEGAKVNATNDKLPSKKHG